MKIANKLEKPTVKDIMVKFMAKYEDEYNVRDVYHIACDLLSDLCED